DPQGLHLLRAIDDDGHHASAGIALDAQFGHLFLQPLLHLLRLLHHLLNVHSLTRANLAHISSTSRISAGNTSSSPWTPASASARSRRAAFLSAAVARSACGVCAGAPGAGSCESPITVIFRPASCWAMDSSHERLCSSISHSARCAAEKVKVMRSPT